MADTELHSRFAAALLDAVAAPDDRNVVVSPWSVSSALAVLAAGVAGSARREIDKALAAGHRTHHVVEALAADARRVIYSELSEGDPVLTVTNTLWVDEGGTAVPAFLDELEHWPGAGLHAAPLSTAPDAARALINSDVAETTRGMIPEILPPGSLRGDSRAVIANALYLLTTWLDEFWPGGTVDEPFHAVRRSVPVPTMRGHRAAPYAHGGHSTYLALPMHAGFDAEVVLPDDGVLRLDPHRLAEHRHRASTHLVDLHLPRFRLHWQDDLSAALRALGVTQVFDRPVVDCVVDTVAQQVTAVFHGADLRVDESGVEGAAATAFAMMAGSAGPPPLPEVELRVDRPFLLLVTHRLTGAVLFLARVADVG